jgi:hypothetical protein
MLQTINGVLFNKKVFKACSILDTTKGELKNQFSNCSNQLKTTNSMGGYFTEKFIVSEIINKVLCLLIPKFSLIFSQVSSTEAYFEDILSIPYPSTISP